jgi:hypothetical protein
MVVRPYPYIKDEVNMSHSKIAFLILNLAFLIASMAIAEEEDDARFRYFPPLSTNVKPGEIEDSDEDEIVPLERSIYRKEEEAEFDEEDFERLVEKPKIAIELFRESRQKAREIEREIAKRRRHQEHELKKFLQEIDREQKKHIVEIEREQRKILQEIEREYKKKNRKRMDTE